MKNKLEYIPDIILEKRKNKQIMESRKDLPKKSLSEISESFRRLNEETGKILRKNS